MLARPLSVALVGALALGAAVLFGVSGCDQLENWVHNGDHGGTGSGGSTGGERPCPSSESCPDGQFCTTEQGDCVSPPGCGGPSGGACPAVCYGVCKPKGSGAPCGKATCGAGEVCCNASCGICTPPNGGCVAIACTDEPHPTPGIVCKADSDCRIEADYCTGCDCRALAPGEKVATCDGPGVQCLVDPCARKTSLCVDGRCTLADAPTRN